MIRTDPSHFGTGPVYSMNNLSSDSAGTNSVGKNSSDKQKIGSQFSDALNMLNQQQLDVADVQKKLITDPDSVDIHDVTTAMAKAQMSLSIAQTVIDRLSTGWSEITTMR